MALGRKQLLSSQDDWLAARAGARAACPDDVLDNLIDRTLDRIRTVIAGKRVAHAWSGGKDSQVLRWLVEQLDVHRAVNGRTAGLEWPAQLAWGAEHRPADTRVIEAPWDLRWLAAHPEMMFPRNGTIGSRWYPPVQHRAQRVYFLEEGLDVLMLGRRRKDGNYCSPWPGTDIYTDRHGVTRFSPIADWSHEAVFALIEREDIPLPPCYGWPRGYQVGTGAWPGRKFTRDTDHGFEEVWSIDPTRVLEAAPIVPAAMDWLRRTGKDDQL